MGSVPDCGSPLLSHHISELEVTLSPGPYQVFTRTSAGPTPEQALVCTVGSVTVWPGASNVIAGAANFTVDIRCRADDVRTTVVADVLATIDALCER